MKRVISLILSIAMVASLATGLAVTGFADNTGITINGDAIEECYGDYSATILASDTNSITVDKIATWTDVEIYIPSGKTLIVSSTDSKAIYVQYASGCKNLTITGGGTLVVYDSYDNGYGIYVEGNITISNTNVIVTHEGDSCGNLSMAAAMCATDPSGFNSAGIINITNKSIVTATNKGKCGGAYFATFAQAAAINARKINITGGSTVVATHEGSVLSNEGGQTAAALYANIVDIEDGCTVTVNVNENTSGDRCYGIFVNGDADSILKISCTDVTVDCLGTDAIGIYSQNGMNFTSGSYIKSKGGKASFAVRLDTGSFKVDGTTEINDSNYKDYFTGTNLSKESNDSDYIKAIKGTDWVYFGTVPTGTVSTGIKINGKDLAECYESYGVSSLTITDDGTVIVDKITTDTDTNINILEGKTLIVSTTDTEAISVVSGNLTITGDGTLEAINNGIGKGIFSAGDITISGVTVKATANGNAVEASGSIKIFDGTLEATAINNNAIYAGTEININNSNVTANGTNGGIYACTIVTISGTDTVVIAKSSGTNAVGIYSDNIDVSGGKVTATSIGDNSYGIYANSYVTITDGIVTANGLSSGIFASYNNVTISGTDTVVIADGKSGIHADRGNVEISGGTVTITASGDSSKGIYAGTDVTISGGLITATASGNNSVGIYSYKNIIISGNSFVKAKGDYAALLKTDGGNGTFQLSGDVVNGTSETHKYTVTNPSANGGYVSIGNIPSEITINGSLIEITITNFDGSVISKDGNTVIVDKINTTTDINVTIDIPQGKKLIISNTDIGIFVKGELTITGDGTLEVYVGNGESCFAISTNNNDITISVKKMVLNGSNGIKTESIINILTNSKVKIRCSNLALSATNINLNGSTALNGNTIGGTIAIADKSTTGIYKGYVWINDEPSDPNPGNDQFPAEEEEQSDPEVDIDFGFGPVTIKTSNKSIVLDDKRTVEKIINETAEEAEFISFDLAHAYIANTKATKDFDGLFLNNEAYRCLGEAGKGIEIINRFARAEISTNKEVGNNPLSLHLPDVSNDADKCSTAIQKRAMQTHKVYAEVYYSFVTNGKPTENDAKIYVPVDGEAKVFYLFNENKIGIVPCEVKDGYCVFDRYFDGTYVVCSTK